MPPQGRTARMHRQVYIANESFVAKIPAITGVDKAFHEGRTRVYEGDEILERCPDFFDLLEDQDQSYA